MGRVDVGWGAAGHRRDCPRLVGGAGNNSWVSLAEQSSSIMSQNGYLEDVGEYLCGGMYRESSLVSRGPGPSSRVLMALSPHLWPLLLLGSL